MNFNVYLDETLEKQLDTAILSTGKKRNTIIREAIQFWLSKNMATEWPESVMNFKGDPNFPPFESYRSELKDLPSKGIFDE